MRLLNTLLDYWKPAYEVGPWIELIGPLQDVIINFHDDIDVQLEGGRCLSIIHQLSRNGLDLKHKLLGWRPLVLSHIKSFVNRIITNTSELLERQKRLGGKAMVAEDVTCFSPRLMKESRDLITEVDAVLGEAYLERDRLAKHEKLKREEEEAQR